MSLLQSTVTVSILAFFCSLLTIPPLYDIAPSTSGYMNLFTKWWHPTSHLTIHMIPAAQSLANNVCDRLRERFHVLHVKEVHTWAFFVLFTPAITSMNQSFRTFRSIVRTSSRLQRTRNTHFLLRETQNMQSAKNHPLRTRMLRGTRRIDPKLLRSCGAGATLLERIWCINGGDDDT